MGVDGEAKSRQSSSTLSVANFSFLAAAAALTSDVLLWSNARHTDRLSPSPALSLSLAPSFRESLRNFWQPSLLLSTPRPHRHTHTHMLAHTLTPLTHARTHALSLSFPCFPLEAVSPHATFNLTQPTLLLSASYTIVRPTTLLCSERFLRN